MFNLNNILIAMFLAFGFYMLDKVRSNDTSAGIEATNHITTTTFLLYTEILNEFIRNNPSFSGVVTTQIILPNWMAKNTNIKMYVENGKGFVYIPEKSNIYSSLLTSTDQSSMVGITDRINIITNIGAIPKPSFIPENHIVYMI